MSGFANALAGYNTLQDISRQERADATNRQAGNALAGGDYTGAANALYRGGYLTEGATVQKAQSDMQDAQRKREADGMLRLANGMDAMLQAGKTPQEAWAAMHQYAPVLGVDTSKADTLQSQYLADPKTFTAVMRNQAQKELQFFQTDQGILAGDKGTGTVSMAYALPGKPDWKEIKSADGSSTWVDVNDPRNQMGAASSAPAAQVTSAAPPSAPRGLRNNNPLNVSVLGKGQTWNGQTGADGQYAVFGTPDAGWAAADRNLQTYATKYGLNTIAGVVNRWAPPGSNDTKGYIATVAKDLGVDPNQPLNLADAAVRQRLLQSMAKVEVGANAVPSMQGGAGADQLAQSSSLQGRRVQGSAAGSGKGDGKWEVYTDPKTNTQFRYNAATHEATTLDGSPYTPSALAKLSGGGAPRSAAGLFLQRFIEQNPTATADDVSQAAARFNMNKAATTAFGTGKQGQTINSLNVSIDHLSTLSDLSSALGNGNIQLLNRARQTWMAQTGNPAPANFEAAKQMVADEIVKGIVGAGGGVSDREKAQAAISAASSPQQLAGVIGTYKQLLAGQLNGLRLQYKNTTGRDDFESKLLPETRAQLEKSGAAPAVALPPGIPPAPQRTVGKVYLTPRGNMKWTGTGWVQAGGR